MVRWLVLVGLCAACAKGSTGFDLTVRVRTDFVPGVDFDEVMVERIGDDEPARQPATFADNYLVGRVVRDEQGLSAQDFDLRATLRRDGSERITRNVRVELRDDLDITILIARDCLGASCPGDDASATECQGGACVDPRCTPETPASCPEPECMLSSDCPEPAESCIEAACILGACLYADRGGCGVGRYCDVAGGCTPLPMGMEDGGPPPSDATMDAPPVELDGGMDVGVDTGPPVVMCGGVTCQPLEYCAGSVCTPYPGCFRPEDCMADATCRNRRCIPNDTDVDGDGVSAATDCDEQDRGRYPGAPERCNVLDDDCDDTTDEGNPGVLCAGIGGECMAGVCGCPEGRFDVDGVPDTGCECTGMPGSTEGSSCETPIEVGAFDDSGQMTLLMGNVLPTSREVWYRFTAIDSADTMCDNFHVRVQLALNPSDAFRFEVSRGLCGERLCGDQAEGVTDMSWFTDFGSDSEGECPCFPEPVGTMGDFPANQRYCNDNTADFFIRVFRRPEVPPSCATYTLEVSNGVYDAM